MAYQRNVLICDNGRNGWWWGEGMAVAYVGKPGFFFGRKGGFHVGSFGDPFCQEGGGRLVHFGRGWFSSSTRVTGTYSRRCVLLCLHPGHLLLHFVQFV